MSDNKFDKVKRWLDFLFTLMALIILSPLMLIAAVLIKATSRGPILYHSQRAGLGGVPIQVYKFRTMVTDAERYGTVTVRNDNRITLVGRWLRTTKVDELPQLFNILRGEMSIVGPRPESFNIVKAHYTKEEKKILTVRPGLTCQGNLLYYVFHEHLKPPIGMDGETFYVTYLLKLKLLADLHYVENRSFAYDLNLIFQTVYIIVTRLIGGTPSWQPKFISSPPGGWQGKRFAR